MDIFTLVESIFKRVEKTVQNFLDWFLKYHQVWDQAPESLNNEIFYKTLHGIIDAVWLKIKSHYMLARNHLHSFMVLHRQRAILNEYLTIDYAINRC